MAATPSHRQPWLCYSGFGGRAAGLNLTLIAVGSLWATVLFLSLLMKHREEIKELRGNDEAVSTERS